ncbi:MAG: MFS transporter [Ruminococcaceae bacterium]|nr:MFS transporter [Oscillospiraceae bacterium]
MSIKNNYNHTVFACYFGYVVQAIVNNFAPLLFLTFRNEFGIPLEKITSLITINFLFQLVVDVIAAKVVDKIGYRKCIVAAQFFSALGIAGMGFLPNLFSDPYYGLLISILLYALGGGLIEVLVSPIVEACPIKAKKAAMSLLHSFYCWGHLFVVLLSTLFFTLFGIENWRILALVWAVIPLINGFYFIKVPIAPLTAEGEQIPIKKLFSSKTFWLFIVIMVCAGASEQGMSQWASTFAEAGLNVSKTVGDLAGPSLFAITMGVSRVIYSKISEKVDLNKYMTACAVLCITSYAIASFSGNAAFSLVGCAMCGFSVGVMWPGAFSLASEKFPRGGTAMFAFLALAGDFGCSFGPTVVGVATDFLNDDIKRGVFAAVIFPVILIVSLFFMTKLTKKKI